MKNVLITGISRGIGEALAQKFLSSGWRVVGTTTGEPSVAEQPNLKVYKLDLSDDASITDAVASITADATKFDVFINNAGVLLDDEETHVIPDKLRRTLAVNLIGTIEFTEKMLAAMNEPGHIVFLSSQAGSITEMDRIEDSHFPYHYPAYKISKCGLNMYVRTLAMLMKHENRDITVSAVHPGWVKTDMGGSDAPTLPAEAARAIYDLAISKPKTGQFWYNGKKYPW